MKLDANLSNRLADVADQVKDQEAIGYAGTWTAETTHDPFLPLALGAEHSSEIELGTSIAVAFARNPMLLANLGYDLQEYSKGRMILGLGSQIKPHITNRFSMEWSKPAARMRELIEATRAIWNCWNNDEKLLHRGEFYTHTLMTPFFDPGPNEYGNPKVFVAAVGPHMLATTGAVADGWIVHPFNSIEQLQSAALPRIDTAAKAEGRSLADIEVSVPVFVVTGDDDEAMSVASRSIREQIAFYGSTPAYSGVLEHHGWGDAHTELNRLSKRGEWAAMADVIDETMLAQFAVVAEPDRVSDALRDRWAGTADRISLYVTYPTPDGFWDPIVADLIG